MVVKRPFSPESLIGKEAKEVVCEIVRLNPQIKRIQFAAYHYIPRAFSGEGGETSYFVDRKKLLCGGIDELVGQLEPGFDLGVSSRVELDDGSFAHIPMMDFCCPVTTQNLEEIKKRLREIAGERFGWMVFSGKSYHYYGQELKSEEQWVKFMGNCLLCNEWLANGHFKQLVETRYVGHRLRGGGCRLRLSNNTGKETIPTVIDIL